MAYIQELIIQKEQHYDIISEWLENLVPIQKSCPKYGTFSVDKICIISSRSLRDVWKRKY